MAVSNLFLALAALAGAVVGQSANATAMPTGELGIEVIQANFQQAGIVGSNNLLPAFAPSALLNVSYPSVGAITPGQSLTIDQVSTAPMVQVVPANASVTLSGSYTLMMVDADIVGAPGNNNTRHWLVNSVTVANGVVSNATATAPETYMGPYPADGSGAHRYVLLLYSQPSSFASPADVGTGIQHINLASYVQSSNLGPLVAANYILVEQGTASASVSATSAVVASTLPAAQTTGSAGSGGASASGPSKSGSGGSAAPSPTGSKGNSATTASGSLFAVAAAAAAVIAAL